MNKLFYLLYFLFLLPLPAGAIEFSTFTKIPFILQEGQIPTLAGLVEGLFFLSIGVGAALAVIMLSLGGLQYMMSDVVTQKSEARGRMVSAVVGLLLLLLTVTIFQTINTDIGNLTQSTLQKVGATGGGGFRVVDLETEKRIKLLAAGNLNPSSDDRAAVRKSFNKNDRPIIIGKVLSQGFFVFTERIQRDSEYVTPSDFTVGNDLTKRGIQVFERAKTLFSRECESKGGRVVEYENDGPQLVCAKL